MYIQIIMAKPNTPEIADQPLLEAQEVARSCLAFRARALSRRITQIYEDVLRPSGLRATQANVMTAIAAHGSAPLSEIAKRIALDTSSLSRIVDVMRRNGWVVLRPDPEDERIRRVSLTVEGRDLYLRGLPLWREAQRRTRALLGEESADAFRELANQSLSLRAP